MNKISFTVKGRRLELSRDQVEQRLRDVAPEAVRTHAVRVNGVTFPVKQAFEVATGIPRADVISHTARRHLGALGFELIGEIESRGASSPRPRSQTKAAVNVPHAPELDEWFTEAQVQSKVVAHLVAKGYRILSVADTATRERGIDIVAALGDQTVAIEVKGYPSKNYADPRRAGEVKRTQPSNQAKHWYAQAVLASMITRSRRPNDRAVIALPDFPKYRDICAETSGSLDSCGVEVWWVSATGDVGG